MLPWKVIKKSKKLREAQMVDVEATLRDIVTINLRFALAEVMATGGKQAIVRALDHVCEAEAFLQILLMEMGDLAREPTTAVAGN